MPEGHFLSLHHTIFSKMRILIEQMGDSEDSVLLQGNGGDRMDYPQRKPLRLPAYDYSSPGAYFVTICTHDRRCILSNIAVGALREAPLRPEGKRSLLSQAVGYMKMNSSKQIHAFFSGAHRLAAGIS